MTHDVKVFDLARAFLLDDPDLSAHMDRLAPRLADMIQQTIDDEIEDYRQNPHQWMPEPSEPDPDRAWDSTRLTIHGGKE